MPVEKREDNGGVIKPYYVARTTAARRKDKAVRKLLRQYRVQRDPEVYAMVLDNSPHLSPEEVAAVYCALILNGLLHATAVRDVKSRVQKVLAQTAVFTQQANTPLAIRERD